mmetsp:Transcript_16560/g.23249  ORF Transcript_16560/g.23249 Transcript_16560/m.23249 type:complete len:182 (-) Transcript_16560:40-585(-)
MGRYSTEPTDSAKAVKARVSDLRVHYKNTLNTANFLKGKSLTKCKRFLQDVLDRKDAVPFFRHTGGIGHHAQASRHKAVACRWPVKSCKYMLDLLQNAESNAEIQGIEAETLYVSHIQVNHAPGMRRRTYRAHGRINPYMSCPCHVELILSQKAEHVKKGDGESKSKKQGRLANGDSGFSN